MNTNDHPYSALTPDCVLDALDSVGVRGDGRMLALGSYENRVYQVFRDDEPPVVAKFYRPARWTDAQILEEHAFVAELVASEIPAVAPIGIAGRTLHEFAGFRFAVFPRRGGRAPELEQRATLAHLGRYIARLHTVGARRTPDSAWSTTLVHAGSKSFGMKSCASRNSRDSSPNDSTVSAGRCTNSRRAPTVCRRAM